jgi:hypothetical protein
MSAPSLHNFSSELRTRNISRPNLYYVEIIPPGVGQTANKLVSMWCNSAHTPQVHLATNDSYIEAGTRRKYVHDIDNQNLVLSFYIDQAFEVKKFFDDWKTKITSHKRNFAYPDDYTSDALNLYIINQEDETTYKYEYSRIYPITFQQIALSYDTGNTISTFSVEFVYEEVYATSISSNDVSATSKPQSKLKPRTKPPNSPNIEIQQYDILTGVRLG